MTNAEEHPENTIVAAQVELDQLWRTGILDVSACQNPLFRPAFTYALVFLKDALTIAAKQGNRLAITGADVYSRKTDGDLTDLIADARNAACHNLTGLQDIGPSVFRYMLSIGPDAAIRMGSTIIGCEYADEAAIFFGPLKIFLRRNLHVAIDHVMRLETPFSLARR